MSIADAIQHPPCFIGRITDVELRTAYDLHHGTLHNIVKNQAEIENNAGIHCKNPASLNKYAKRFLEAYDHCTHIAEWSKGGEMHRLVGKAQEWIAERTPHTPKLSAIHLEPYYEADSGWMPALKGKRVLIIHPFAQTFQKQAHKIPSLFPNRPWFEDCTLLFVKPPMTMAGNHQGRDWEEHLDAFLPSLDALDFDVALVAAGGYGMLISDVIFTQHRKSVIYIGGALQLFFGVIGKRWFTNPTIMKLVTDDWVRPASEERPPKYTNVEKGCYW